LRSLLSQYGWRGKVPVVVTRARLNGDAASQALSKALDAFGASLVHQVPAGLDNAWTVRPAQGGAVSEKRQSAQIDLPLLQFAAGENRRPVHAAPPAPVATFLTTPLREQVGSQALADLLGHEGKKLGPLVEQIATRDPMFAGHHAALRLAGMDQAEVVTAFAGDPVNGREALFKPLLSVSGESAAERAQGVQTLLPLLADLAGAHGITDHASYGVLMALNAKLAGTADDQEVRDMIWDRKDSLPDEVKAPLVRLVSGVKENGPETDHPTYDKVIEYILTCPDPDGEPGPA
jgi:hypothetical protein